MVYALVRPLARIAISIYFQKIYLSNADRIPKDKPVLLACNHPTGFLEPCILACFLDRPLYFLVRGDFFAKRHFERMLRALHMLPVFRFRDGGYSKLKENLSTFQACHQALRDNRSIMIFAEGSTLYIKQLRPLQKGIARIAMGSLEAFPDLEDVFIVPVGVTYTDVERFRSRVMIDCGKPLLARDFEEAYRESPNEGMQELLDALAVRMRGCLVHVEKEENEPLVDELVKLQTSVPPPAVPPVQEADDRALKNGKAISESVATLIPEEKAELAEKVSQLQKELKDAGLPPGATWPVEPPSPAGRFFLALTWFPAMLSRILNAPPLWFIRQIVDKRVKQFEFKAPIRVAGGLGIYVLYLILLLLILGVAFGWPGWLFAFLPPLVGWLEWRRYDLAERARISRIWNKVPNRKKEEWQKSRGEFIRPVRAT